MFRTAGAGARSSEPYDEELGDARAAGAATRTRVHGKPAPRSRGAVLLWLTVALVMVLYYAGTVIVSRHLHSKHDGSPRTPTQGSRPDAFPEGTPTRVRRIIHHHSHRIGTDLSDVRFVDMPDVAQPRPTQQQPGPGRATPTPTGPKPRADGVPSRGGGDVASPRLSGRRATDTNAAGGVVAASAPKPAGGSGRPSVGLATPAVEVAERAGLRVRAGVRAGVWSRNEVAANNARPGTDELSLGAKHVGFVDLSDAPLSELYKLTGEPAAGEGQHESQRAQPSSNPDVQRARLGSGGDRAHGASDEYADSQLSSPGASSGKNGTVAGLNGESLPARGPHENPDAARVGAAGAARGSATDASRSGSDGAAETRLQRPAASPVASPSPEARGGVAQAPLESGQDASGTRVLKPDGQLPLHGLSNPDEQARAERRTASPAARVLTPDGQLPLEALRNPDEQAADELAPAPRRRLLSLDSAPAALPAGLERPSTRADRSSGGTDERMEALIQALVAGEGRVAAAGARPGAKSGGGVAEATVADAFEGRVESPDAESAAQGGAAGESGAGRTTAQPVGTHAHLHRSSDLLALLARGGTHEAASAALGGPALAWKRSDRDDSVRCRTSGICDDAPVCVGGPTTRDEALACTSTAKERRAKVVESIEWAWQGYEKCAWGQDELAPVSCSGKRWFGLGLTLVDSMDTLVLAGLHEEAARARDWVVRSLDFEQATSVNVFETTIRVLGGLLAATHLLGGDRALLLRAIELALRLLGAFASPGGLPKSDLNLATLQAADAHWTSAASLAEMTTLSVEFGYAAQIAQRPQLAEPAMHVWDVMRTLKGQVSGLAPIYIDASKPAFSGRAITLGARGDSYYEYMLKQWIARGKRDTGNLRMYHDAMAGIRRHLIVETAPLASGGLTYVQEMTAPDPTQQGAAGVAADEARTPCKMDHLVCFLPGVLALGSLHGVETGAPGQVQDLALAQQLMHTCYQMYKQTPTGLAPEIVHFREDADATFPKAHPSDTGGGHFVVKPGDAHNLLRPETMESLFVLWRVTRNETYREWGWRIFCAFEMHARVATGGYSSLDSVLEVPPPRRDKMESFFLSETLKYALLLFDDTEVLPLTSYVFNTEGHPVPVLGSPTELSQRIWYLSGDDVPAPPGPRFSRASLIKLIRSFRRQHRLDVSEPEASLQMLH